MLADALIAEADDLAIAAVHVLYARLWEVPPCRASRAEIWDGPAGAMPALLAGAMILMRARHAQGWPGPSSLQPLLLLVVEMVPGIRDQGAVVVQIERLLRDGPRAGVGLALVARAATAEYLGSQAVCDLAAPLSGSH
jgi:hypothetical protein